MEDLLDYLRRHFLVEPELLARSGVSLDTLRGWQRAGAAPWPSYRLTLAGEAASCMGSAALSAESAWYPRGMLCWLGQALALDGEPERLRTGFESAWREGLAALELPPAEAGRTWRPCGGISWPEATGCAPAPACRGRSRRRRRWCR
ncbi:hypothetical protein JOS77_14330 [Chromobacterium haemolyticum]|nr:hypothetical protein JOS77_14330 [Chromobacterium haemolyticum]